jgi:RNA polymerase sigma-70 factor (ECF subfamily)
MKVPTLADDAMTRYASGDREAFTELYDAVAPRLFAYLSSRTRNTSLAEDLLQQTLFQIHRAQGTFILGSPVMPWAFAIARRLLIDEQRRARRSVLTTASDLDYDLPGPEHAEIEGFVAARQLEGRMQEGLGRLPHTQRTAFEMTRLEGLSHSEAAQALGITVSALKLRAHRAYVALRAILVDDAAEAANGAVTRG